MVYSVRYWPVPSPLCITQCHMHGSFLVIWRRGSSPRPGHGPRANAGEIRRCVVGADWQWPQAQPRGYPRGSDSGPLGIAAAFGGCRGPRRQHRRPRFSSWNARGPGIEHRARSFPCMWRERTMAASWVAAACLWGTAIGIARCWQPPPTAAHYQPGLLPPGHGPGGIPRQPPGIWQQGSPATVLLNQTARFHQGGDAAAILLPVGAASLALACTCGAADRPPRCLLSS